jgi:hypothetical protein
LNRPTHPHTSISFPVASQRQVDSASDNASAAFVTEARDTKALVRERMKFRLAQLTGGEVEEPRRVPIAPVSGAAILAIGNPLDRFILDQLGRCSESRSGSL